MFMIFARNDGYFHGYVGLPEGISWTHFYIIDAPWDWNIYLHLP